MSEVQKIIDQYLEDKRKSRPNYGVSIMKFNGGWDSMRGVYDWEAAHITARVHSQADQLAAITYQGMIVVLYRNGRVLYLAEEYQNRL